MTAQTCAIAMAGAGKIAREHLRAFEAIDGVHLAGIYSRTRSRAEQLASEFRISCVCNSIEELYSRTEADLIVVAVSIPSVVDVALSCFDHPWTVLLEKPPGINLAEAEIINKSAIKHSRQTLVALNRRFLSSTEAVIADTMYADGPRFIHVQDQQDLRTAAALGHSQVVLNNWPYANSIHLVDYFNLFGRGTVQSVIPIDVTNKFVTAAAIHYTSGDFGLYQCLWNRPGPWGVSVSLAEKRWELRPLECASYQTLGQPRPLAIPANDIDVRFKPGFYNQARQAVAASIGETHTCVTLEDTLHTMHLIHRIYHSSIHRLCQPLQFVA